MDYEVIIIGGGVVGLAIAQKLSAVGKSVLLLERHGTLGSETSSRNSEVIHAGIYYKPNSLKAKMCVPGNIKLYEWCVNNKVPHRRIGKFIVAVNSEESAELDRIYETGMANGVPNLQRVPISRLHKEEPNVKAVQALWSPDTGIIDSHLLMKSLADSAVSYGCDIALKHELSAIEKISGGYMLSVSGPDEELFKVSTDIVINSAGLDCDTVAAMAGIDIEQAGYKLNYCRGHYFRIRSGKKQLASHLIYPVPKKSMPGLGIHVTVDMAGELKLGPDTVWLEKRAQDYSVPENLREKFYTAASSYLQGIELDDIYPDQSGIRPKLQMPGSEPQDFIIKEESDNGLPGMINLIGIESPGLTCCIEIAEYVSDIIG